MKRAFVLLFMGLALVPAPARAQDWWGTPSGRLGLGGGMDDHVTGRETPDPTLYPHGNLDGMGRMSLRLGTEVPLFDDWGFSVAGRIYGDRFLSYPDFSLAWGNLSAELARYALFGWNLYAGGELGQGWSGGQMGGGSLSLERSIGWDIWASLAGGGYRYNNPQISSHLGLWVDGSLYRQFGAFALSLVATGTQRAYSTGTYDWQGDLSLGAIYRFNRQWSTRLWLNRTQVLSSDVTRAYGGDQANLGLAYDFL